MYDTGVDTSVADPHPDPDCHLDADADPDTVCHFDAVPDPIPDPSFQLKAQNLKKVLK
jgi:hypothetical protein